MKRRILAVLATFALLITAGCSTSASNEDAIEEERAITVSVDYIKKTDIEKTQTVTGQAKPIKEVNVIPKLPGKVSEVYVSLGDEVKEGQTLFTIDDKEIKLQLAQAEAAVNVAKANVKRAEGGALELQMTQLESAFKSAEINLNDAQKMYDDVKILYENGMASKQDLDRAKSGYELAKEQFETAKSALELTESRINKENIETAQAQLKQAKASYNLAKTQLENTVVTSPADGYISSLNVNEGEITSGAVPAATIVDISTVVVEVNIVENIVNKIKVGDEYPVYIESVKKEPFLGKVISISPNVDPMTQSYRTRIEVPNEDGAIKGGMSAKVEIAVEAKENILAVPVECVVSEGGKSYIYVVEEDRAVKKEVTTGISNEEFIEISGDIKEGSQVVVKGQNFLSDNSKVIVAE
ncbi:MAG TPA: efflux RND transporter periplasmic adaptor subunit [Ruminiclostridium sp.]|jgi:multidrug efflux pump subunit AcrA (membrane-fusion protein)|uniref:Macrolide export protein MacA n=1 Tax=Acetivibrio saccincola TaxID=1677857 RepID=A0A2K9E023_9FIRM|nr:efflux RND transporter periplasmic adaptor subunit [Acetivibrio saccincola]AUG57122.1 Macrolide export protein MacA [Acetivibrio saccincola]HAA43341.1 efflux RND transporter periplasmic adaptor subunit [Ruminiclostridium sp.]HOA96547.1 efflux RND transporter periplasmic adaptor subunit [Acetivibrio saccincola]HQD29759.1 efflux RND transporter periplasmic adaptor subunit [Acetivibrio saccincola]